MLAWYSCCDADVLQLDVGPFVEAGGVFVNASAALPNTVVDNKGGALLLGGAEIMLSGRLGEVVLPYLALDAGAVLVGFAADADNQPLIALSGPVVGTRIGVAFGF